MQNSFGLHSIENVFHSYPLWSSAVRTSLLTAGCRLKPLNGPQDPLKSGLSLLCDADIFKNGQIFTKYNSFSCRRPTFATTFYFQRSINFELPDGSNIKSKKHNFLFVIRIFQIKIKYKISTFFIFLKLLYKTLL